MGEARRRKLAGTYPTHTPEQRPARSLLLAQHPDLAGAVAKMEADACDEIVNDLGCRTKDEARAVAERDTANAARIIGDILDGWHAAVKIHANEEHNAACRPGC